MCPVIPVSVWGTSDVYITHCQTINSSEFTDDTSLDPLFIHILAFDNIVACPVILLGDRAFLMECVCIYPDKESCNMSSLYSDIYCMAVPKLLPSIVIRVLGMCTK